MFTAAIEQAGATGAVGVRLRAVSHLAAERLARGELAEVGSVAHRGIEWAEAEGLVLAPFGLDLQHLHFRRTSPKGGGTPRRTWRTGSRSESPGRRRRFCPRWRCSST